MTIFQTGHPEVDIIGALHLQGNIVPHSWYRHIRYETKRGVFLDAFAVFILADLVYWYRPVELRDEVSGQVTGYRKKFAGDKLKRSAKDFAELFGCSEKVARDSMRTLEQLDLIDVELRSVATSSGIVPTQMYVGLQAANVAKITYPITAESPVPSFLPISVGRVSQLGEEGCPIGEEGYPNSEGRVSQLGETTIYKRSLNRDLLKIDRSCQNESFDAPAPEPEQRELFFWERKRAKAAAAQQAESSEPPAESEAPVLVLEPEPKTTRRDRSPRISTVKGKKSVVPQTYVNPHFAQWFGKMRVNGRWVQQVNKDGYFYWCQTVGVQPGHPEDAHIAWVERWGGGDAPADWHEHDQYYREIKLQEYVQRQQAVGVPHACRYIAKDTCYGAERPEAAQPEKFQEFFARYSECCEARKVSVGDLNPAIAAWNVEFKNPANADELFSEVMEALEYYFLAKDQIQGSDRHTDEQKTFHPASTFLAQKWRLALQTKRRKAGQTEVLLTGTGEPEIPFGTTWDDQLSLNKAREILNAHWSDLKLSFDQPRFHDWMQKAIALKAFEWNSQFGLSSFPDWVQRKLAWDVAAMAGSKSKAA